MSILLFDGQLMIFKDSSYVSHDLRKGKFDNNPKPIKSTFNMLFTTIDCVLGWDETHIYFFKGMDCIKHNQKTRSVVQGYPKKNLFEWRGAWLSDIKEAMRIKDKVFFFRDGQFIRYDINAGKPDNGYPKAIINDWHGVWEHVEGAEYLGNNKVLFLKGDEVIQYDLVNGSVDTGFPLSVKDYINGKLFSLIHKTNNIASVDEGNKMAQIYYDVELIIQEQNPICWVACCAMLKGWATQSSIGVGEFTGGFDPANSSIANLAENWQACTDLMESWGFAMYTASQLSIGSEFTADDLNMVLTEYGPFVLLHTCQNFPYGNQWGDSSAMAGAHAVVITGMNSDYSVIYFNNPWGDKDQSVDLGSLLQKINSDTSLGKTLACWQS